MFRLKRSGDPRLLALSKSLDDLQDVPPGSERGQLFSAICNECPEGSLARQVLVAWITGVAPDGLLDSSGNGNR